MESTNNLQILSDQSPFSFEFFSKILDFLISVYDFIVNPKLWNTLFIISSILSVIFIGIIIYTIVRIRETQVEEKEDIKRQIDEAEKKRKEKEKRENPKWHYILSLMEGFNDSDWRMAIIEADSMMEEILKDKGMYGSSLAELLNSAKSNGYRNIQDAWDAHIIRNKIAHEGSDYPLTQVEGRRVLKMYQNFFEELDVI